MSFLAKFAASKYVGDKLEENFGPQNPKYEIQTLPSGRQKKTKRPLPPGLTPHEARILKAVRRKAYRYEWLVDCHCCCGLHLQFGTATIWGLLPLVGDIIALAQSLSLIRAARRVAADRDRVGDPPGARAGGLPALLTLSLLAWAVADFLVKLVPVVGDVITAVVKPNTRNLMRVEAFLRARGERRLLVRGGGVGVSAGAGVAADREPLLGGVQQQQPAAQAGMTASYGTARGAAAGAGGGAGVEQGVSGGSGSGEGGSGRRSGSSRHLLPFWRHEDTDSEEDEEAAHRSRGSDRVQG